MADENTPLMKDPVGNGIAGLTLLYIQLALLLEESGALKPGSVAERLRSVILSAPKDLNNVALEDIRTLTTIVVKAIEGMGKSG